MCAHRRPHCGLEWVLALLAVAGATRAGSGAAASSGAGGRMPWGQDDELAVLGSLDMDSLENLLAYDDLQRAKDAETLNQLDLAWLPAEPDPQLYLLTEYDRSGQIRAKRARPPVPAPAHPGPRGNIRRTVRNPPGSSAQRLSIVNPLDVLRQRLLLEIARRRKASTLSTPLANRELLEGIGKRASPGHGHGHGAGRQNELMIMDSEVSGAKRSDPQEGVSNRQRQRDSVEGNNRGRGQQDEDASPWAARRQANVWSVLRAESTGAREN